jgi:ATP-dependent DNA ligase
MKELANVLPKITPLVVTRRAAAFDNETWLFELKYDGFRALLEIDGTGARLVSRNRNRFKHLDTLAAALAKRGSASTTPSSTARSSAPTRRGT